jgi:ATP synthase subunit C.
MNVLIYAIPVIAVFAAGYVAVRFFKQSGSGAKALKVNFAVVALVFAICMFGAMTAMASGEDKAKEPVDSSVADTIGAEDEETTATAAAENTGLALGLGLLAAALSTSISGIGGGIAVASAAPAAIGATSEDPKAFGKALIFVALGESIALYGLVIAIMILNKI